MYLHIYEHNRISIHTHKLRSKCMYTCMNIIEYLYIHTNTHIYKYVYGYIHKNTHLYTNICNKQQTKKSQTTGWHKRRQTHVYTCTNICTCTHTHTRTYIHTYICTKYVHTLTCSEQQQNESRTNSLDKRIYSYIHLYEYVYVHITHKHTRIHINKNTDMCTHTYTYLYRAATKRKSDKRLR